MEYRLILGSECLFDRHSLKPFRETLQLGCHFGRYSICSHNTSPSLALNRPRRLYDSTLKKATKPTDRIRSEDRPQISNLRGISFLRCHVYPPKYDGSRDNHEQHERRHTPGGDGGNGGTEGNFEDRAVPLSCRITGVQHQTNRPYPF